MEQMMERPVSASGKPGRRPAATCFPGWESSPLTGLASGMNTKPFAQGYLTDVMISLILLGQPIQAEYLDIQPTRGQGVMEMVFCDCNQIFLRKGYPP